MITYLQYNWCQYMDTSEAGETFESFTVGKNCEKIERLTKKEFKITITENEFVFVFKPNLFRYITPNHDKN